MNYPFGLKFPCAFILLFCCGALLAQSEEVRAKILAGTKVQELNRLAAEWELRHAEEYEEAVAKAREMGWPLVIKNDSLYAKLERLSPTGNPLYLVPHNSDAAISTQTNQLHSGGGSGLNLNGAGMIIAEWDLGEVLTTHEQLVGRVYVKDQPDTGYNYHATHVAGTLIGSGSGNSLAKGMAHQADLWSYGSTNDDAEMAATAASGILISNHSYGYGTGWSENVWWGDTNVPASNLQGFREDPGFGMYYFSQNWDSIAHLAPYYLIVKSAGNDRNQGPVNNGQNYIYRGDTSNPLIYNNLDSTRSPEPDGGTSGYESIAWRANAKNILTVGAVNDVANYLSASDVLMASYSSWGPTDDGRIKPDLVGNGIGLHSAYVPNNNSYGTIGGTSMSTPNVSGSLLLLQEHYIATKGTAMKASTLKALAIHTARECGSATGPDYKYGWGLLSARDAADLISDDTLNESVIQEVSLTDGEVHSQKVVSDGSPLRVTVCWTDPPGPKEYKLNPTSKRLVHDLDITVNDGPTTYQPYVLDPINPSAAATTGDNDVDNVELVYIPNPQAGRVYTINITNEGSLQHNQDFAMIISGHSASFYSTNTCATGCNAEVLSNWNSIADGSGFSLPDFEAADRLVLQTGHTANVNSDLDLVNPNVKLVIESGAILNVNTGNTLTLAGAIENHGEVNIASAGSLLQTAVEDKNTGTGLYNITRNTGTLANHRHYQYWSSPVDTATMTWVFQGTNQNDFFQYHPTLGWQGHTGLMQPAEGYITTPTVNSNAFNFNENRTFSGRVNNGNINFLVSADSGEFILAGNPYPSAFSADSFVAQNQSLKGALYFFNQTTGNTNQADYAVWNSLGAVQGGRGGVLPDDFIQSCQGFFVQANESVGQVSFSNRGRVAGNNLQFFKRPHSKAQRVWLTAEGSSGASQMLLGFFAQASAGENRLYDAPRLDAGANLALYSFIGQKQFAIQARPQPVSESEKIRLGFEVQQAGTFNIAIDSLNGWPPNRQIYLWDSLLGYSHNLQQGAYQFSLGAAANFQHRFYLWFSDVNVSTLEPGKAGNKLWTSQKGELLHIYLAQALGIKSVTLSALSGQTVLEQRPGQRINQWVLNISSLRAGVYLLQLRDENSEVMRLKVYVPSG